MGPEDGVILSRKEAVPDQEGDGIEKDWMAVCHEGEIEDLRIGEHIERYGRLNLV